MKPLLPAFVLLLVSVVLTLARAAETAKAWKIEATKDQTFVVKGEKKPVITAKAGESITFAHHRSERRDAS
jgi:hypothetical protein